MFVEICSDCVMANAGYDDHELGQPYSTEYPPMALLQGYVVTATDHDGRCAYDNPCEGHFGGLPCDGCGEVLGGSRFCHSAIIFSKCEYKDCGTTATRVTKGGDFGNVNHCDFHAIRCITEGYASVMEPIS
jgi:hypothetical protein